MKLERAEKFEELHLLRENLEKAASIFTSQYASDIEIYRQQISLGLDTALEQMQTMIQETSGGNLACARLLEQVREYVSWMQWSLWDLPYFAIALRPSLDSFRQAVTACGLVYISIRIFDDAIDQHFTYKTRHSTLLATTSQTFPQSRDAQGLTILAGLLLCFEGLRKLVDSDPNMQTAITRGLVPSIQRAVIGAIMEYSDSSEWTSDYYERLVRLKNVDYWHALYAALDPEHASPLYPFLEVYYNLAQNLNDVQDIEEDQRLGQPNLLSLYLPKGSNGQGDCPPFGDLRSSVAPIEVESLLADKFLTLAEVAAALPLPEEAIAQFKLFEALQDAYRLGLFAAQPVQKSPEENTPHRLNLGWYADVESVIEQASTSALEQTACPVCNSDNGRTLFQKQGFSYHRCLNCSHIYVNPRITAAVQAEMLRVAGDELADDEYLDVQRIYAEAISHRLLLQTPGPRLLDIGFGKGYLLSMAQAYGFEVYGLDSAKAHVELLYAQFGNHVVQCIIGREAIPWKDFDVVVMSHVLEHLHDPELVLKEVKDILNPGGLLYVAVPDMDSLAFQIFGKNWEVINPLVHLQYFNQVSLSRLFEKCGFTNFERIQHPHMPEELSPRWMRLYRSLGGSEINELAILARIPK
jgi:2-polyprenyl-3-methyl-5-hydroxy-6-metoxy-1,4-benzoquinol methylase